MSYGVRKGNEGYNIYEKDTEQIIELGITEKYARDVVRKLNLGSGFNGWTPSFFTIKFPILQEEA